MDPLITEFASGATSKLHQLNASQQPPSHAEPPDSSASNSASNFILPLRESKLAEADAVKPVEQKRDKGRFFGIRHKVSLLHSKSSHYEPELVHASQTRASTESTRKSIPFDQLFLALPNELQVQVLSSLPLTDILTLRLTSKSWHTLITLNESPIVRYHLDHHIPAYALRLYPITNSSDMTFHFLCSIWHRLHVAAKLAFLMCEWITKEIFLRQSEAQRAAFAPQHERMRRRLIPLLFTIFHFFETYRKLHLKHMAEFDGHGLHRMPYTVNPIEKEIMDMYDDQTLLRVHEVFPLRPSDEVHSAILCLGGLRQVERLWEIKGYNSRRTAVDTWYNGLTKEHTAEASTKLRMGLKGFGRKKSAGAERPGARSSNGEGGFRVKNPMESDAAHADGLLDSSWIFSTSLAADRPMGQLPKDHAQSILNDLPVLQQIWLTTAEAMILDRAILQRTQDIKRNQQVMLDLIREDGMDEEDEWWYGRSIHESIRPPPGATDDDAD
ncbi:f-box domain-containing protein [Hirsutella rhossiliensis]|uniref:F-box domain-containing protein n=1 Tax=Hirsutella rhossiliensis TaxID=111463 RepID=A0A9P8SG04_9HYPO|nr:f-box domain-containing protein [Hirsutella rhossiliensis]KAH0960619.1 f-box domain-containing protein [Hirsutella rhossiliensis]